jgi:hypothetical protein
LSSKYRAEADCNSAPFGVRNRSLAAFDLDPSKEDALTFGARNYHKLQVVIRNATGISYSSSRQEQPGKRIGERMEEAQLEAFDEDLFNEV